jgi:hypothetical protein
MASFASPASEQQEQQPSTTASSETHEDALDDFDYESWIQQSKITNNC